MTIGFFTVLRRDPQHALHAVGLVESIRRAGGDHQIVQLTDETTPAVTGVDDVRRLPAGPMLERRLEHYSTCDGDWLLVDTDVQILVDVGSIFCGQFDLAVADRNWPGIPQGDATMHTMPFNTGVVFSRTAAFWQDVLAAWRAFSPDQRDWMSEQRAFYQVVRTGAYRVLILPGEIYNYPPRRANDPCTAVRIAHYKGGERKIWLTDQIRRRWQQPVSV